MRKHCPDFQGSVCFQGNREGNFASILPPETDKKSAHLAAYEAASNGSLYIWGDRWIDRSDIISEIDKHLSELYAYGLRNRTTETGQQITARFFEAADALVAQKKLRGIQTLAKEMDTYGARFRHLRAQPETFTLKQEWIHCLVTKYSVSADWLITDRGKMFT